MKTKKIFKTTILVLSLTQAAARAGDAHDFVPVGEVGNRNYPKGFKREVAIEYGAIANGKRQALASGSSASAAPSEASEAGKISELLAQLYKKDGSTFWKYATPVFDPDMSDHQYFEMEDVLKGNKKYESLSPENRALFAKHVKENPELKSSLEVALAKTESSQKDNKSSAPVEEKASNLPKVSSEAKEVLAKSNVDLPDSPVTAQERADLNPTQNPLMDTLLGYKDNAGVHGSAHASAEAKLPEPYYIDPKTNMVLRSKPPALPSIFPAGTTAQSLLNLKSP